MRFFIALEIPSENIPSFQFIQTKLHTLIPQAKITDVEKIHLTLAFLGEQQDQLKDELIQIIQNATKDIPVFEVTPAYMDGFPNIHKRAFTNITPWLKLNSGRNDIIQLCIIGLLMKRGLKKKILKSINYGG